jgi:hypothetical protein
MKSALARLVLSFRRGKRLQSTGPHVFIHSIRAMDAHNTQFAHGLAIVFFVVEKHHVSERYSGRFLQLPEMSLFVCLVDLIQLCMDDF